MWASAENRHGAARLAHHFTAERGMPPSACHEYVTNTTRTNALDRRLVHFEAPIDATSVR
jgi:hypothetical protein